VLRATFVANLRFAAGELGRAGIDLLTEPINAFDIPGFYLNRTRQAIAILDDVGAANAFVQYDIYHAQRTEGELAATLAGCLARIGHIQLAAIPADTSPAPARSTSPSCSAISTVSAIAAGSAANTSPPPAPRPGSAGASDSRAEPRRDGGVSRG